MRKKYVLLVLLSIMQMPLFAYSDDNTLAGDVDPRFYANTTATVGEICAIRGLLGGSAVGADDGSTIKCNTHATTKLASTNTDQAVSVKVTAPEVTVIDGRRSDKFSKGRPSERFVEIDGTWPQP